MKKVFLLLSIIALTDITVLANDPDTVYLFSYATTKNNGKNGLHFAWSRDRQSWFSIGNEYSYVRSDYGRWHTEKRMINPFLAQGPEGAWHCVWALNEREPLFAHAASKDLVFWGPQSYPLAKEGTNCLRPVVQYDDKSGSYHLVYTNAAGKCYKVNTKDFKSYSVAKEVPEQQYNNSSVTISLQGSNVTG